MLENSAAVVEEES